ncbi:MAG TPA: VWA domain-containing protein, partial [Bacteroidia bacterium]|nr:VWA domain-containing protein [Bacteroidia bacterium]
VVFFTDTIEKFIPPKKGKSHILRIIRELINFAPASKNTDISQALRYFTNVIKKRSIAFVISDFIDSKIQNQNKVFEDALKIASKKHDLVALRIYDEREFYLPDMGLITLADAETGNLTQVDSSSKQIRKQYEMFARKNETNLQNIFNKCGVDCASIRTDQNYVQPLIKLFKKREKR